ncbi:MAG: LrgB family protein [Erysipelotrichaceae bacterium]|nr:LrgB family protein [Erysipelotrichaceae bacterium]
MNNILSSSTFFGLFLTLAAYVLAMAIKRKLKSSLINPLLIAIVICIAVLLFGRIEYDTYNQGAKYISVLLTPATVCLAVPLYTQIEKLKQNFRAIMAGILSGVLTSLGSILLMSKIFGFSHEEYVTFLPKSITTAIGMSVSEEMGGYVAITVTVIVLTGVFGNIICESVLKLFGIRNRVAKGIAIGTASHAIGTSKAMEIGEIEGAMSSLSIVVSGILTVILASIFARLY